MMKMNPLDICHCVDGKYEMHGTFEKSGLQGTYVPSLCMSSVLYVFASWCRRSET